MNAHTDIITRPDPLAAIFEAHKSSVRAKVQYDRGLAKEQLKTIAFKLPHGAMKSLIHDLIEADNFLRDQDEIQQCDHDGCGIYVHADELSDPIDHDGPRYCGECA